jgi:2-methylcitrate dehydratase
VFSVTEIPSTKTRPTVERIAHFADRARATHLQPDARGLLKRNILDSLGCAIAALPGPRATFIAAHQHCRAYMNHPRYPE